MAQAFSCGLFKDELLTQRSEISKLRFELEERDEKIQVNNFFFCLWMTKSNLDYDIYDYPYIFLKSLVRSVCHFFNKPIKISVFPSKIFLSTLIVNP